MIKSEIISTFFGGEERGEHFRNIGHLWLTYLILKKYIAKILSFKALINSKIWFCTLPLPGVQERGAELKKKLLTCGVYILILCIIQNLILESITDFEILFLPPPTPPPRNQRCQIFKNLLNLVFIF